MAAGEVVDIQVLDHVVLGSEGRYLSMQEQRFVLSRMDAIAA